MNVVALLATYNEERFIRASIEHLRAHGVGVHLIDNCSEDRTVAIAEEYLGQGVVGIETLTRDGEFSLRRQLRRKEELALELDADWLIHLDADELHLPPPGSRTLAEALADVDREGFNAVNFLELTFIPTREAPDHDHPQFERTLRTYYPFLPAFPHRLNAWKQTGVPVELEFSKGHRLRFEGLEMYPESFRMKHYLFLSVQHAVEKFVERSYDSGELEAGWHGWRARVSPEDIVLPAASELRETRSDDDLDTSDPRDEHHLGRVWAKRTGSAQKW
jgi:glycosyltransferase involved in cell wall biosynthesis